ncbi:hypothetical protein D3C86_1840980 [compost metagenome]
MVHQITDALNNHPTIVFAAMLWGMGFLLKLLQRRCILLRCARFIELRLQEVHHLVKANISAANGRQQLIQFVKVVARQQVFFRLFDADT